MRLKLFGKSAAVRFAGYLLMFCWGAANGRELAPITVSTGLKISVSEVPRIVAIQAHGASLRQVIDELALTSKGKVHYAALPETPVDLDCSGRSLREVMGCIFQGSANVLTRSGASAKSEGEEIWILGSALAESATAPDPQPGLRDNSGRQPVPASSEIHRLMDLTRSENPSLRMDAFSQLTAAGMTQDPSYRQALSLALADPHPGVRAQAVFGLSREGGEEAMGALQEAMGDSDAEVRRMAVESVATDGPGMELLKAALRDEDRVIRELAALKLEGIVAADAR